MREYDIPVRGCSICNQQLPATLEYFSPQKGGKYGLYSRCKTCMNALAKAKAKGYIPPSLAKREQAFQEMLALPPIEGARRVFLEGGHGAGKYAIVDDAEYEGISQHKWHLNEYPRRNFTEGQGSGHEFMHRRIMGIPPQGMVVDHINGDVLDNRRSNLRVVGRHANSQNRGPNRLPTKRFKGVFAATGAGTFRARIWVNGKGVEAGISTDEVEAARLYDAAARHFFGEFARLNLPDLPPIPHRVKV